MNSTQDSRSRCQAAACTPGHSCLRARSRTHSLKKPGQWQWRGGRQGRVSRACTDGGGRCRRTSADYSRVETQSPQFRYYGYGYMYLCTVWCCSRSRQFALSRYERANSSCELIRLVSYSQVTAMTHRQSIRPKEMLNTSLGESNAARSAA